MVQDSWQRTIEYVRLSLTEACNFCCPYCRPKEITAESQTDLLSPDEWLVILDAFHQLGIRALRLTGGEPLLYPQLDTLLEKLQRKQWFEDMSITTNGSLLATQAERLHSLGLQRINISLDAVDEKTFDERTGRMGQLQSVIDGIEAALAVGFKTIKINTVLMEALSDEAVQSLLAYMDKWQVIWRFIEYMPFQGHTFSGPTFEMWQQQLERVCGGKLALIGSATENNTVTGFGPATYYRLPQGHLVGFIFPMSHTYCNSCNRVRLTSDGRLRLCLLRDDEIDLANLVRQGITAQALKQHIVEVLQLRKEQHGGVHMNTPRRAMWRIGG